MPKVFEGRVFSVEVDDIRFPDGRTHRQEIVRHPPSVVLITLSGEQVILIRQFRAPLGRETWEFPAGSLNRGESAEHAALRECEEEIGLVPGRLERVRGLFPCPGFCDEELIFFRASELRPPAADSARTPDADENIHVQRFSRDDARAMLARGEIVDLKTAYGLTLL
jgi:ADP-ribose pyrophosphatase